MRCEQEGPAGVHLNSEVGWFKRMHLCTDSIRIVYRKIVIFHLPSYSIAIIALLNVRKVTNRATTGSKKVSVFGFAVKVVDKQGDDSPFFVIKDSKKSLDSKGQITYLLSFSEILKDIPYF